MHLVNVPQHIIQRGNNRQATFFAEEDYCFYLECLGEGARKYACSIYAYVLMTNHVHLLASAQRPYALSLVMQYVGRYFVCYINRTCRRTGTLWEGRFRSSLVSRLLWRGAASRSFFEGRITQARRLPPLKVKSLPGITLVGIEMTTVSVTSKGQVTIPKRVRRALGITPGSKVEFDIDRGGARLRLVKRQAPSRIEDGPPILNYSGPRIPTDQMHGGFAMRKVAKRARR